MTERQMIKVTKSNGTTFEIANTADNLKLVEEKGWGMGTEVAGPSPEEDGTYTVEQLAEISEIQGMKGLKAIADPLGVTATSKDALIEKILEAQGSGEGEDE